MICHLVHTGKTYAGEDDSKSEYIGYKEIKVLGLADKPFLYSSNIASLHVDCEIVSRSTGVRRFETLHWSEIEHDINAGFLKPKDTNANKV
jgi:hypothetical protein